MNEKQPTSFALRLSPSLREAAMGFAKQEGISLNHFISLAVAEKISRMEQAEWLKRREKEMAANRTNTTPASYSPMRPLNRK